MKKMNRSQSSYRPGKTLLTEECEESLVNKYASRHYLNKNQVAVANKLMDANKQNNSLFQSISQRNFTSKSREQISQFDAGQDLSKRVYKNQNLTEEDLSQSRDQKEYFSKNQEGFNISKGYNYSETYYQSEISSLKEILQQKDKELQYYKKQYNSKNDDMDSMTSQMSSKLQKDNKEKNMYIRQINAKVIEINNLKQRVKIHKAEIQTLRLCINEKDKVLREFEEKLGQIDMKKKKVQHYQYQMKQYHQTLRQLESKAQRIKQEAENKDFVINQKCKSIFDLQQTIGSYEDKLRSIQQNLINISEERKTLKDKNQDLLRECNNWRQSYHQQLKKNQSLQDYQIKLKTYQGLLDQSNRRIMELTSHNQKIKITALTNEKTMEKYKQIERQMISLKRDIKQKQQKILELYSKEKNNRLLEQSNFKMKKQKDEIFMKLQQKIKECKSFSLQFQEQKNRANCLDEELREIEENNTRIKQRGEKMQVLMKENNRLTSTLHQKINQIQKLQIKINNLEIKFNQKVNQGLKMKSIIQQNQQEIHETKLQVQDLRQRYEIQTNNRIINQDRVLRCSQENYSLKCNISKLQSQNKEAVQQLQQLHLQHQNLVNNFKEMTTEMMQNRQQSQYLLEQSRSRIQILQIEVRKLRDHIEQFESKEKQHKYQMMKFEEHFIVMGEQKKLLQQEKYQIIEKCHQLKEIHEFVMRFKSN